MCHAINIRDIIPSLGTGSEPSRRFCSAENLLLHNRQFIRYWKLFFFYCSRLTM